jgi:hypothetical protein
VDISQERIELDSKEEEEEEAQAKRKLKSNAQLKKWPGKEKIKRLTLENNKTIAMKEAPAD